MVGGDWCAVQRAMATAIVLLSASTRCAGTRKSVRVLRRNPPTTRTGVRQYHSATNGRAPTRTDCKQLRAASLHGTDLARYIPPLGACVEICERLIARLGHKSCCTLHLCAPPWQHSGLRVTVDGMNHRSFVQSR